MEGEKNPYSSPRSDPKPDPQVGPRTAKRKALRWIGIATCAVAIFYLGSFACFVTLDVVERGPAVLQMGWVEFSAALSIMCVVLAAGLWMVKKAR